MRGEDLSEIITVQLAIDGGGNVNELLIRVTPPTCGNGRKIGLQLFWRVPRSHENVGGNGEISLEALTELWRALDLFATEEEYSKAPRVFSHVLPVTDWFRISASQADDKYFSRQFDVPACGIEIRFDAIADVRYARASIEALIRSATGSAPRN